MFYINNTVLNFQTMLSNFLSKLEGLFSFCLTNRQTGTTTLLQKISEEHDVVIIVVNSEEKAKFNGKAFTLLEIEKNILPGKELKPFLLDNGTVQYIANEATTLIRKRTESLEAHRRTLTSIKKQIEVLENEFGETDKPIGYPPKMAYGRKRY